MAIDFKTLIGVAFDIKQAQSELDRQIKSLQKSTKLALEIELSDKEAKKAINDSSKMWSNYRKEAVAAITAPNTELKKMAKYYKQLDKDIISQNKLADSMAIVKNRADGASQSFQAYTKTLKPQALKSYSSEIRNLSDLFTKASESGKSVDLSKANSQLGKFKSEMKNAGMETASFSQILKDNISAFSQWYFIGNAVGSVVRNFRDAIGTIVEVDTLLTEISKTSDLTGESLKELGINAFDAASKYGNTVQSYLEGYKEMSRGTDKATAQGLAEMSILAQSAGDMTSELANEYIIATNAAYKFNNEVSKINSVLDSQNQVSNRNQISMSKIAEATKVAGSVAANSGVEINELTAAISVMGVVTQGEGQEIGRAFKGILQNLQQVKGETDDGEIIDTESLSKVEKATEGLGVKLKETRNGILSLRDPMQVLKELATEYSKLEEGDVRGTNLITALGGKYRSNQLSALLSNYELYTKILGDYENANGSALSEAQKTADSIEGRLNKLTNTWNEAVANVVSSDMLKTFVSIGTGAIELVDDLNLLQTALIGLGGVGTYKFLTSFVPMIKNAITSTITFGNTLNTVNTSGFVANTANLKNVFKGLSDQQKLAVVSTNAVSTSLKTLTEEEIELTLVKAGLNPVIAKNTAATLTNATATGVATTSTLGFGASIKALTAAIASNPIGFWITVITAAISALSFGMSKYKQHQEELLAKNKELAQSYKEESDSIDEQIDSYKKLQKQLNEGNLSTEESKSVKEQLISIQDTLNKSYGDEASNLSLVNGKYKEQLGLLSDLSEKKAQDYIAENKIGYEADKKYLSEKDDYTVSGFSGLSLDKDLQDYLKQYKDIQTRVMGSRSGETFSTGNIEITLDDMSTEKAYNTLTQLYADIDEKFGNGKDAEALKLSISKILNTEFDKTEIEDAKKRIQEYTKAEIIANDTLRPLYQKSADAVEEYNNAVASGDTTKIEESTKAIDKLKKSVYSKTDIVDGSKGVFDGIFNSMTDMPSVIGKAAEYAKEKLTGTFADKTISDSIDKFQSSMATVKKSLEDVSSLDTNDIIDLMQQFPKFDWSEYGVTGAKGVGYLESALKALAREQLYSLDATSQSNEAFLQMYRYAIDTSTALKTVINSLNTLTDATKDAEYANKNLSIITDAINKKQKLTDDQVLDLISHYPELEKSLIRTTNGWYLEKAALDTVGVSATNLQSAYLTAQKAMNDMLADGVKLRLEKYKIELDGITTIAQAYQEINKEMKNQTNNGAVVKGGKVVGYWSGSEAEKVYQESTKYAEAILALNEAKLKLEKLQNSLGKSSTKIGSTSTKTKSESSKVFDWLSIRIEKLQQKAQSAIDSIANQISYKAKNAKINIAVEAKKDEKSSLKTIQSAYNKMASDVKLPKKYRDLVNNGGMKVETIKDEKLANKIEEYTKFKDAANEVGKSIKEINNEIKELRLQKLDNIKSYFDSKSSIAESRISKRESEISLKEAKGGSATKGDYNYLIDRQKTLKKNTEDEYKAYEKTFNNLVKKNKIAIGSPEWREGVVYLEELETQINECDIAIEGFKTNISELTWDNIDDGIAKSSKLTDKLELLASQIKDDELFDFDEDGNIEGMSEKGIAKLTLYQSAIESSKKEIKKLNSAIDKLNKQYKNNKNDAKYIERLEELESQLIDTTQSMKSYADSISDVMNSKRDAEIESINKKISKYQELINARKKDLQEQRDAKKYKDTIDDATGEISKIEKRIAELQSAVNSGDREAIAELKTANDELAEKKKALADTQYDHEIELAEKALDESAEQYEKNMNTQIDTLNSYYDTQEERITMAAQLTKDSFTDAWETISQIASESNIRIANDLKKLISSTIGSISGNVKSTTGTDTSSKSISSSPISSLLGAKKESNKTVDQSKLSALNKYLSSEGYDTLNTSKMVLLAQQLGLNDINSIDLLGSNTVGRKNKNRILEALKKARFSSGGYVDASMIKATGEDGLALVKHGEPILTVEQGKLFKELIDNIKPLNNLTKLARPNMSNIINNNRTTPIENNTYLTINGDASELTVQQLKKYAPEITEMVSKTLIKFNK